jgi:hypothetical protein
MSGRDGEMSTQFREVLERANLASFAHRLDYCRGIYPKTSEATLSAA